MENTVTIGTDDYSEILGLALRAAILRDALFANAALGYSGKSLIFAANTDIDTMARYLFPDRYAEKVAELKAAEEDDEQ